MWHCPSGLRERFHTCRSCVRRRTRRRPQQDARAAPWGCPGDHGGGRWIRLQAPPVVRNTQMFDIFDILVSCFDLNWKLFNLLTRIVIVSQFPWQVPQNSQGPHAPLWDHLPAVRRGEWPRSRSHLRRGLQDGCVHADAVTRGEAAGKPTSQQLWPCKGSTGCTEQNLYYSLYLLVLDSLVTLLTVHGL